jgi:hypothetical protein
MEEVGDLTEGFERDGISEWHDDDWCFWMIWYWVDGDEGVVCWGSPVFSAVGGSVVGLSGYGGWFFVLLWFCFFVSRVQDRELWGQ